MAPLILVNLKCAYSSNIN